MIGIVVGLAEEARLARCLGGSIGVGNGTAAGAQRAVDQLIRSGATALLSFGIAGGLAPGLAAGTIVIPPFVLTAVGEIRCDMSFVRRLGGPSGGSILAYGSIASSVAQKAWLHATTGAVGVDLESGAVAMTAAAEGLPFAVLRAICDPAERALPDAAQIALDDHGRVRLLPVLGAIARHPSEIISSIKVGLDAAAAHRGLARYARRINLADRHAGQ